MPNFNALLDGQHLQIKYDTETDELVFTATVQEDSWFGIGFGPGMYDVDMIVWLEEDDETLDLWSSGYRKPD
jgi:hypothetical protein